MTTTAPIRMDTTAWVLLFTLSFIWGGAFLFGRIAVQEIPPLTLVFARVTLAALFLHLWLISRNKPFRANARLLAAFAVMGVLNNVIPFSLIFWGQQEIGAGLASVINAMTPIWTLLIAHRFTGDERLATNKVIGIVLGFSGVAVLIGGDALTGLGASTWAQIAVLGATISYGFAGVFGRRFAEVSPSVTATGQLTASALIVAPFALLLDAPWTLPTPSIAAILSVLGLAALCTSFAYILFFRILARAGAVNVSLVTLLIPAVATVLGAVFLGERLAPLQFAGMALILLGLTVIDGRIFKMSRT